LDADDYTPDFAWLGQNRVRVFNRAGKLIDANYRFMIHFIKKAHLLIRVN